MRSEEENITPEGHAMRESAAERSDDERENLRLYGQRHSPANSVHFGVMENGKIVTYLVGWQHGYNGHGPITINPDCPKHILKQTSFFKEAR